MTGARSRNFEGWPLFATSFRPFFLFGALQAGLSILVWLPMFHGEVSVSSAFAPRDWHIHEMLYGFLPAVITGFLFTAIPNWTGRLPIRGTPLAVLLAVWLAGRVVAADITCTPSASWNTAATASSVAAIPMTAGSAENAAATNRPASQKRVINPSMQARAAPSAPKPRGRNRSRSRAPTA